MIASFKAIFVTAVPAVLSLLLSAAAAAQTQKPDSDWAVFSLPSKEFSVQMPPNVRKRVQERAGALDVIYYQSDSSGTRFDIEDGAYVDPKTKPKSHEVFFNGLITFMIAQFKLAGADNIEKIIADVDGNGWHGRKVLFRKNGIAIATMLVAYSNRDDVVYTLLSNAGDDNANVNRFFNSLVVDPAAASRAHLADAQAAGISTFVGLIWIASVSIMAAVIVSIAVSLIRNRKKEK